MIIRKSFPALAVDDMGGSVAGMKIEIVAADHPQKLDVGATIVRRWFDQENLGAVADVPSSSVALAINQIARADNKVLLPSSSQSLELTATQCSPNTVRWTIDTWATSHGLPTALMKGGGNKTWFFAHADNAYWRNLVLNATEAVTTMGGQVVGLANYSADLTNFLKQANEFGLLKGDRQIAAFVLDVNNVRAVGGVIHAVYLYQIKSPAESKGEWDYFRPVATLPGEKAFGPMNKACPLVSGG